MRALLYYLLPGTSFLFLIAFSWYAADSAVPAAVSASELSRAPASTPAASREQASRLLTLARNGGGHAAGEAAAIALAEHFTNFGPDGELARAAVDCPEPMAQAVGLRILAALPPSGENLSALGNGLRHSTDPALAEGAVKELERYLGTRFETDAQRIVEAFVSDADKTPAQHAAALVRPFINEHSVDEFRELSARLDSGAEAARALRAALEEYDRRK